MNNEDQKLVKEAVASLKRDASCLESSRKREIAFFRDSGLEKAIRAVARNGGSVGVEKDHPYAERVNRASEHRRARMAKKVLERIEDYHRQTDEERIAKNSLRKIEGKKGLIAIRFPRRTNTEIAEEGVIIKYLDHEYECSGIVCSDSSTVLIDNAINCVSEAIGCYRYPDGFDKPYSENPDFFKIKGVYEGDNGECRFVLIALGFQTPYDCPSEYKRNEK